jgi:hypothetical protein
MSSSRRLEAELLGCESHTALSLTQGLVASLATSAVTTTTTAVAAAPAAAVAAASSSSESKKKKYKDKVEAPEIVEPPLASADLLGTKNYPRDDPRLVDPARRCATSLTRGSTTRALALTLSLSPTPTFR